MAEKHNENRRDEFSYTFYILLKEMCAKKQVRDYSYSGSGLKWLLKGEIIIRNHLTVVDSAKGTLKLHPFGKPSYYCDCPIENVKPLEDEEAMLLLSFKSNDERYKYFTSNSLDVGKKMTIGSIVYVKVRSQSGGTQELRGVIRYKGPLSEEGTMFGVELLDGKGRGTTDGHFKGQRYFKCDPNCGLFVALDKLRPYEEKKDEKETGDENLLAKFKHKIVEGFSNLSNMVLPAEQANEENCSKLEDKTTGHKLEDRVWVYIEDKLCGGCLKYIGRVPGGRGETFAGIYMDNPVGRGNGEFYGNQLITCPMDHAHFTLIKNVISEKQFQEMYDKPEGYVAGSSPKDNPSSIPQTSEDIIEMESKFSKTSQDKIVNEQQEILQQIKAQKLANQKKLEGTKCDDRGTVTMHDKQPLKKNGNCSSFNHVSHATIEVNKHTQGIRNQTENQIPEPRLVANVSLKTGLDIGSMVEVLSKKDKPTYGLIRWIGFLPNTDKKVAGLELEEEMTACTDGTFQGKRYFTCQNGRGFFVHLHSCLPDSRFNKNSIQDPTSKRLSGSEFGPYKSPIIEDQVIPPAETMDVYLKPGAQGIQGHHNSCYLDATLFAAFAFSSVMDSILFRPKNGKDIPQYESVQTVLRNNIIYPLRSHGFVRADRVMELRELLDKLGNVTGLMGEEKDPEEFLLTLLQQVLKSKPFLKIKSGKEVRKEYFYQVLAEKDVERVLPSVEELLKRSFYQSDLKLAEVPSCLIVQMPRFGKGFKMYDRILPSLKINIGELVDNAPQDCAVCGLLALYHCKDCFAITGLEDTDCSGNFCADCLKRIHSHVKRNNHKYIPIAVPRHIRASYVNKPVEHREMELFAVICIQTSHYVTFAKCEEPGGEVKWCFFDSMADRIGTKDGYNIPSVTECPEVIEWLSSEKQNRERIINTEDKRMPDRVRRLLGDAYVCLYESKEMAMYR